MHQRTPVDPRYLTTEKLKKTIKEIEELKSGVIRFDPYIVVFFKLSEEEETLWDNSSYIQYNNSKKDFAESN